MENSKEQVENEIQKSEEIIVPTEREISDKKSISKFKQCLCLIVGFIKALKDIFDSEKQDDTYVSLAPTKNADPNGTYSNALKYAIDNKEIRNIAIAGKYGSGKSSIIKTFFDKLENKKYNPIFISLAAFNKNDYLANNKIEGNDEKEKDTKEIQTKNEFYHTLEKSILQQLLYQASEKEVPLSRFRRISKHSKVLFGISTLFIIISIITIICLIFPPIIDNFKNNYKAFSNSIGGKITVFLVIALIITIITLTYKTIFFLSKRFNISKFKFKDAEVEINDKAESIFNKYLDEIIYFFQVTDHQVVVIEDLDRYEGDASFIFQKLRELNTLINSSNQVKYEVDFIYAIRDNFFENYEERTKFFDYIIPVIPITSSGNSNELIWKRLQDLKSEGKLNHRLKKSFIDDISIVVEDKRLIDNTINEFIIYKNVFDNEHMDDTQLFSIILYKNICPKEYAELQENGGNIFKQFKNKKEKIEELTKEINNKKRELEEQKELVISEKLKTSKELKCALLGSIYDYNNYDGYGREFQFGNERISIEAFINTDIDIKKFTDSTISFKYKDYNHVVCDENKIFSLFGNKTSFISRIETLNKGTKAKIEEIQNEIEKLNDKIADITKLTIKQLIEEYGENKIFNNEIKDIEKFLIINGYITEEYKDYITLFAPGNITKDENSFIFAVKNMEILPFDYKLDNVDNVLKRLKESDFDKVSILNFKLLDCLIDNNDVEKQLRIVKLLDNPNYDSLQFIDEFVNSYKSSSKYFINVLVENSKELWKKVYKRLGNDDYITKWVKTFLMNKKSLGNVDYNFFEYVATHKNIDKYINDDEIDTITDSLIDLEIKFENIAKVSNTNFLKRVYENDLYELNTIMIKTMLEINHIDLSCFDEKNLSIIMGEENQLKKYVLENFNDYFNSCYTLCTSDNDDENSIMEVLNNDDIDLETKKQIIANEKFNEYNIEDVDDGLVDVIVQEDKLKITYNNLLEIIQRKGDIDQNLANHINKHFEEYAKLNINDSKEEYDGETIDLFINQYILSKEITKENFETLFKTFNKIIEKIEEIDLDRIEYLINNSLIEFNNENYEYIETNIPEKLFDFIVNNKHNFIEEIEQYDIEPIKNELLVSNKLSSEDKMTVIKHCNIEDLENNTICNIGIHEKIYFTNEGINSKVLQDINIDFNKKIEFLKTLIKGTEDSNQVTEYIHLIGNGYEHINTVRNSCTINDDYANTELFDLLKQKRYISSFRKGKRQNYIIYNKLNRNT